MRLLLVAIAAILSIGASRPAPAEVLDALVGRVNGQVITLSQVRQEAEIRRRSGESPSLWASPRVVREALVRRSLLVTEARKLRITVPVAQVDRAIAALMDRCGGQDVFWTRLSPLGLTADRLWERTERDLLQREFLSLRREMTFVPESEIRRFYQAQSEVFGGEGRYAEVRDQVRAYLAEKRFRKELEGWISDQVDAGRVELLPLPGLGSVRP